MINCEINTAYRRIPFLVPVKEGDPVITVEDCDERMSKKHETRHGKGGLKQKIYKVQNSLQWNVRKKMPCRTIFNALKRIRNKEFVVKLLLRQVTELLGDKILKWHTSIISLSAGLLCNFLAEWIACTRT